MRYLLLIYTPEEDSQAPPDPAASKQMMDAYNAFTAECAERGVLRGGEALATSASATTVRLREGRTLVTDGPFAETKEQLGGYYVLDCRDLDEALELAARVPGGALGAIEIRPIWEIPAEYSGTADRRAAG